MSDDYGSSVVSDVDEKTGYPVDQYGFLLDPEGHDWKVGDTLRNLTSPYGHLEFVSGSSDDFVCFDYRTIKATGGREFVVLHSVINSETGGFIETFGYHIVSRKKAVMTARLMTDSAYEWLGINGIRHNRSGWNQDMSYFFRCVCMSMQVSPPFKVSERMKRFGGKKIYRYLSDIMLSA
jgi:hypothetical protein